MEPQLTDTSSHRFCCPQAWSLLGGVLCVSRFVERYLQAWAPPGTFASRTSVPASCSGTDDGLPLQTLGSGTPARLPPPFLPRLRVVPLSAWGCLGEPPFPDIGGGVAQQLRALAGRQAQLGEAGGAAAQRSGETLEALGSPPFCIGVLKLTPEKGCSIVFELARRLPHRRYGREWQRDRSRTAALYPILASQVAAHRDRVEGGL